VGAVDPKEGTDHPEFMTGEWTLGKCAHCGGDLVTEKTGLYCSDSCDGAAKDVRYFRRCYREGRVQDPQVQAALRTRMAFHVVGGYDSRSRALDPAIRRSVLEDNDGFCCSCHSAPAAEVDHIKGPSSDRANLQGLCASCHSSKTRQSMVPMTAEDKVKRDAFMELVFRSRPKMAAHDELAWPHEWRARRAETRVWATSMRDDIEAGYFGDGSTGTVDDHEHGVYLQMLAERDD